MSKLNKLHASAVSGDLQGARDAIASAIDIDCVERERGNTALMLEAFHNHESVVSFLIDSGAKIDARCKAQNTALMKAAWRGACAPVALLVRARADVNAVDNGGLTPLIFAAFFGHLDVTQQLVDAGANVNAVGSDGTTALRLARERKNNEIAAYLESKGAVDLGLQSRKPASCDLWYRSRDWSPEIAETFWARLKRSRSSFNKAQYPRIKALKLSEGGRHQAAVELLEYMLTDCAVPAERASGYLELADALRAVDRVPDAIVAFRRALESEREFPGVQTEAWLDYGEFAVLSANAELFDEVLAVLSEFGRTRGVLFPVHRFRLAAIRAAIPASQGATAQATEHAREALHWTTVEQSGIARALKRVESPVAGKLCSI